MHSSSVCTCLIAPAVGQQKIWQSVVFVNYYFSNSFTVPWLYISHRTSSLTDIIRTFREEEFFSSNDIVFATSPFVYINREILTRCEKMTVNGKIAFQPIPFQEYHPIVVAEDLVKYKERISSRVGYFDADSNSEICLYAHDVDKEGLNHLL